MLADGGPKRMFRRMWEAGRKLRGAQTAAGGDGARLMGRAGVGRAVCCARGTCGARRVRVLTAGCDACGSGAGGRAASHTVRSRAAGGAKALRRARGAAMVLCMYAGDVSCSALCVRCGALVGRCLLAGAGWAREVLRDGACGARCGAAGCERAGAGTQDGAAARAAGIMRCGIDLGSVAEKLNLHSIFLQIFPVCIFFSLFPNRSGVKRL